MESENHPFEKEIHLPNLHFDPFCEFFKTLGKFPIIPTPELRGFGGGFPY